MRWRRWARRKRCPTSQMNGQRRPGKFTMLAAMPKRRAAGGIQSLMIGKTMQGGRGPPEPPVCGFTLGLLFQVKQILASHMTHLLTIMEARPHIVKELLQQVRLVVATTDVWAKWQAGMVTGEMRRALRELTPVAAFIDEVESCVLEQILACCTIQSLRTIIFVGDENQNIERVNPNYTRTPWVNVNEDGGSAAPQPKRRRLIEVGDQQDHDDVVQDTAHFQNPLHRQATEWLQAPACTVTHLNYSKRQGPEVTKFLALLFPFCRQFCSDNAAPKTELMHVYYNGASWRNIANPQAAHARSAGSDSATTGTRRELAVGWHNTVSAALATSCWYELENIDNVMRSRGIVSDEPAIQPILILVFLSRVLYPLRAFMAQLFLQKNVRVALVDQCRGINCKVSYILHHRRSVGAPVGDQYAGIQADPKREYCAYTRALQKVIMLLEYQKHSSLPVAVPPAHVLKRASLLNGKQIHGSVKYLWDTGDWHRDIFCWLARPVAWAWLMNR